MSTYDAAEAALLALVRTYHNGPVPEPDDWRALDAGGGKPVAVLEMAGPTTELLETPGDSYGAYGEYQEVHQIGVWVCYPRGQGQGGDGAAKTALKAATEALKDALRPYRRLDGTSVVRSARILRTTNPAYISPTREIEAATHVAQQIVFEIRCEAGAPEGEMDG